MRVRRFISRFWQLIQFLHECLQNRLWQGRIHEAIGGSSRTIRADVASVTA